MYQIFFFLVGLSSFILQAVVIRELIFNFYGNEFFIGLILAFWLIQTATGSFLGAKINWNLKKIWLFLGLVVLIFSPPLMIVLIRLIFNWLFNPLISPNFFLSVLFIIFTLLPICFLIGFLFSNGVKIYKKDKLKIKNLGGRAYFWETLGITLGGIIFNFLLVNSTFPLPVKINHQLLTLKFPNLIETVYSPYGIINITQEKNQINFYENGKFVTTNSDYQLESTETKIHLIFTFHPSPEKILILGNLFLAPEVLKYPSLYSLDYLELDPLLLKLEEKYASKKTKSALTWSKTNLIFEDPRSFLSSQKSNPNHKYDLVIFNLPELSTIFVNRLATTEVFSLVAKKLKKDGLFVFSLPKPADYFNQEFLNLAAIINETLNSAFTQKKILQTETEILFLASDNKYILEQSPKTLLWRFKKRNLPTNFLTADALNYWLNYSINNQLSVILNSQGSKIINSDFQPLAFLQNLAFWQTKKNFTLAKLFNSLKFLSFNLILGLLICFLFFIFKKVKKKDSFSLILVAFSGFNLMSLELVILWSFQAVLGYIFQKITLILILILLGMSLGNWLFYKIKIKIKTLFILIYFGWFSYYLFLSFLIKQPWSLGFYYLALTAGIFSGFIFPLTNQQFKNTGNLYTADLLGSFGGSFISSLIFLPIFGVFKTVFLLALIQTTLLFILLQKPELYK